MSQHLYHADKKRLTYRWMVRSANFRLAIPAPSACNQWTNALHGEGSNTTLWIDSCSTQIKAVLNFIHRQHTVHLLLSVIPIRSIGNGKSCKGSTFRTYGAPSTRKKEARHSSNVPVNSVRTVAVRLSFPADQRSCTVLSYN
jgi:hypothetical protein